MWIEDDLSRDIDVIEPLTLETRAKVHRVTGEALDAARASLRSGAGLPSAVVDSLTEVADALVGDLLELPDAALTLDDLSAFDTYTHRHSVQVTVLGLLLARRAWTKEGWTDYRGRQRYDRFGDRMRKLGVGLLVHDVGKLAVPPEVLNKPAQLNEEEMEVMRTHPEAGVELLRAADLSPLTITAIRDHHERPDGTGYPNGLAAGSIHEFARFAAVADVYDAVTNKRVYSGAVAPHVGVRHHPRRVGNAVLPRRRPPLPRDRDALSRRPRRRAPGRAQGRRRRRRPDEPRPPACARAQRPRQRGDLGRHDGAARRPDRRRPPGCHHRLTGTPGWP